jgi:outer membrane protein assembly factor BamB
MMKKATITLTLLFLPAIFLFARGHQKAEDPDPQWTVINIYQVHNFASGLAWDGTYFYMGSYGGSESSKVYRFNPATTTNEYLFDGPSSTLGLTWDGSHLWITNSMGLSQPSRANKVDMQGNILEHFNLPARMMSGIAYDNGDFWAARYESPFHKIYHLQLQEGQYVPVDSFPTPTSQPWEIARQDDILWITDYNRSEIHQTGLQGNLIATFPASLQRTSGVVHDGQYLWYLSRSSATGTPSFLYQVDLSGGGTPEMVVDNHHDFGNVTLGSNASWDMHISNTGTGQLTIEDLVFPANSPFSTSQDFPFNIPAGDSTTVAITFAPDQINFQEVTALLQTNDPANLEVGISLEGIGLESGPFMLSHQDAVDFGSVRIHSSNKKYFVFQNMGDAPLEITQVQLDSDRFYFDSYVAFPYVLEPVETLELPFWFIPEQTGATAGNATVTFNNELQSPLTIPLTGEAQQTEYAAGDLLWQYQFPGPIWNHATSILTVPDLNEDGVPDVMLTTRTGHLRVFNSNASGLADLIWERHLGIVDFPKAVALGSDINGDGLQDIIVGTAISDEAITAVSSRTGENIWRVETSDFPPSGWIYMVDVSHDFNGNGYLDVVAAIGNSGSNNGSVMCINGQNGEILWHTQLNFATYSVLVVEGFHRRRQS